MVNFGSEIEKQLFIPKVTQTCLFHVGFITHPHIRQTTGLQCGKLCHTQAHRPQHQPYNTVHPPDKKIRWLSCVRFSTVLPTYEAIQQPEDIHVEDGKASAADTHIFRFSGSAVPAVKDLPCTARPATAAPTVASATATTTIAAAAQ